MSQLKSKLPWSSLQLLRLQSPILSAVTKASFCLTSVGMVPIVIGGSPEDYYRIAPPNSYIHIGQFPTLGKLAEFIHYLDRNDTAYSAYFAWKALGTLKVNL
ncbi:unnamed protein product [Schistocephalus solidus]|uniref:Fucosyltransferase n=1 Tax=Schistocephalus solidus TaxID=70667 RepID=A0A183SF68_SCHSO|nr:unnamed protein product [Schistocephalus solidus]